MSDAVGKGQSFGDACQRLFGISEQPLGQSASPSGACPWIVPAINEPMGTVRFRIVKPAPRVGVLATLRRFTGEN